MKTRQYLIWFVVCALCVAFVPCHAQQPEPLVVQTSTSGKEIKYKLVAAGKGGEQQAVKSPVKKKGANASKIKNAQKKVSAQKKKVPARKKGKTVRKKEAGRYVALKTNVPFLAVAVSNLALEVEVHKHVTVDFPVMWSISDIEREHAVRGILFQPEGRWWLDRAGKGHFFGLHAHVGWFNLKWNDKRYQTEKRPLAGAGISYGYKLPLGEHWGAEFNVGFGYANMKYNTYYNIENGAQLDARNRHYWGITRAGVSLVYRF